MATLRIGTCSWKYDGMIYSLTQKGADLYVNANNHYEGSAPMTIEKISGQLGDG